MLAKFRQAKQREIDRLVRLQASGNLPAVFAGRRPDFASALRGPGIAVIAEYKRASPSRGAIRLDLEIEDVAAQYAQGGAAALSVLTETDWFGGDIAFLERARRVCQLPILRKDFIFDPLQIVATAATPASALLLIARMVPDAAMLADLLQQADAYGIASVVEIFDHSDLDLARKAGASIIQVNARDLDSLRVDTDGPLRLIAEAGIGDGELWIAASGIRSAGDVARVRDAGFAGALIGGALMEKPNPGQALAEMLEPA